MVVSPDVGVGVDVGSVVGVGDGVGVGFTTFKLSLYSSGTDALDTRTNS